MAPISFRAPMKYFLSYRYDERGRSLCDSKASRLRGRPPIFSVPDPAGGRRRLTRRHPGGGVADARDAARQHQGARRELRRALDDDPREARYIVPERAQLRLHRTAARFALVVTGDPAAARVRANAVLLSPCSPTRSPMPRARVRGGRDRRGARDRRTALCEAFIGTPRRCRRRVCYGRTCRPPGPPPPYSAVCDALSDLLRHSPGTIRAVAGASRAAVTRALRAPRPAARSRHLVVDPLRRVFEARRVPRSARRTGRPRSCSTICSGETPRPSR